MVLVNIGHCPVVNIRMAAQSVAKVIVSGVLGLSAFRGWHTVCFKLVPFSFHPIHLKCLEQKERNVSDVAEKQKTVGCLEQKV